MSLETELPTAVVVRSSQATPAHRRGQLFWRADENLTCPYNHERGDGRRQAFGF